MADYFALTESYYCLQVGLGVIEYIVIAARDRFIPYPQDGSDRQVAGDTLWGLITVVMFLIMVPFAGLVPYTTRGPVWPSVLVNILVMGLHMCMTLVFFLRSVGGPLIRGALVGGWLVGSVGIVSAIGWEEILENDLQRIIILGTLGGYLGLRLWGWWQTLVDMPERKHQQTGQTGEATDKRQASTPQSQACPGSPQAKHPNEEEL